MSLAVPLSTMRTEVRRRANIENSTFITDAEIDALLNEGLNEVYDLLVQARAQEYKRSASTITTVAGTSAYALPSDFYELLSVDIQYGSNLVMSARPYAEFERNMYKWLPGWQLNAPVYYRLQGNNINFIPVPSGAYSVTLNYYPAYTTLVNNSDTFDGVSGWEAYGIWFAVAACQSKHKTMDPSFAMGRVAELKRRIEGLAALRDAGNAERVHDVTDVFDELGRWY